MKYSTSENENKKEYIEVPVESGKIKWG